MPTVGRAGPSCWPGWSAATVPDHDPLGATMAVAADGTWRGSRSGGCVEGIVLNAARAVLAGAAPHVTVVSPGDDLLPWEDAPACTGALRVVITPAPAEPVHSAITAALADDRPLNRAGRAEAASPLVDSIHCQPTGRRGTRVH